MDPTISQQPFPPSSATKRYFPFWVSLYLIGVIIIILVILFLFENKFPSQYKYGNKNISPYILSLTSPVYSISGVVQSISRNTISLKYQNLSSLHLPLPASPASSPDIVFQISVTPKTAITKSSTFPASPSAKAATLSMQSIKVGQYLSVGSMLDLRTLTGNQFEASYITLPPDITNLSGIITAVSGDMVSIKGTAISSLPWQTTQVQIKQYQLLVRSDTKITDFPTLLPVPAPGVATQVPPTQTFSFSDLKVGMQVSVSTNEDITTSQTLTAASISVIPGNFAGSHVATSSANLP